MYQKWKTPHWKGHTLSFISTSSGFPREFEQAGFRFMVEISADEWQQHLRAIQAWPAQQSQVCLLEVYSSFLSQFPSLLLSRHSLTLPLAHTHSLPQLSVPLSLFRSRSLSFRLHLFLANRCLLPYTPFLSLWVRFHPNAEQIFTQTFKMSHKCGLCAFPPGFQTQSYMHPTW